MTAKGMDEAAARAAVVALVARRLGLDAGSVGLEQDLVRDLGADSLDILVLAAQIESAFDVSVPAEALEGVHTVQDILAALARAAAGRGEP